jgi:raffinose/stachyose/melibiose transport system permease protein
VSAASHEAVPPVVAAPEGAATAAERPRRKPKGRAPGEPRNVAYLYVLPGLAAYALFTLYPLVQTLHLSFYSWDGLTPRQFVGFGNFRQIWDDPEIRSAFGHSLQLVIWYSIVPILIGLLLTALLTRFEIRGFMFFRTVLFLPQTIATVVVAQAFVWIYDPIGPLNKLLGAIGLGSWERAWLADFNWALTSVGWIGTWIEFGLCMVLFLAGVQKIPTTLYEAARIDGAGFWRELTAVTLPGLRNELVVAATLTTITALRNFDIVYNTTSGGPGGETEVPSWLMFHDAFEIHQVGMAAAIATTLTIIIAAVAVAIGRFSRAGA